MRRTQPKPKVRYIVSTHIGDFDTWATSARRAISNIRFRLFGPGSGVPTTYWKAVIAT